MPRTFDARVTVEVDADSVGEMLERLAAFTRSLADTEHVRVVAYQYDAPKGEQPKVLDLRDPGWKSYLKDRR